MISLRYGALLGLGAALWMTDTSLSSLVKLGIIGAGWLITGGKFNLYLSSFKFNLIS